LGALSRVREWLLRIVGYLIPLVQSLPSLSVWAGLMTLPLATYLVLMFTSLPASLPAALAEFFSHFLVLEKVFVVVGLLIFVYSIAYLKLKKSRGLVTTGPYRLVRHPQYFGIILLTIGLTGLSVWILNNTFGIGFLTSSQTIMVWFIELLAYVVLAQIEELFLSRQHGAAHETYTSQVSFLVPYFKTKRRSLDVLYSVLVPSILLFVLVNLQTA